MRVALDESMLAGFGMSRSWRAADFFFVRGGSSFSTSRSPSESDGDTNRVRVFARIERAGINLAENSLVCK